MNRFLIVLVAALWMTSCTKQGATTQPRVPMPEGNSSLVGKWILTDTASYNIVMGTNQWQAVHTESPIEIEIKADSSLTTSANYPWNSEHYDRIKRDVAEVILYSTTGYPSGEWHPAASVQLNSTGELILTRHWVDTGVEQRFKRVQ